MTGCIAGMGPKIHWNKAQVSRVEATEALYPEHDMEVKFDVHVDRWNMQNSAWRLEDRPRDHGSDFWVFSLINMA